MLSVKEAKFIIDNSIDIAINENIDIKTRELFEKGFEFSVLLFTYTGFIVVFYMSYVS